MKCFVKLLALFIAFCMAGASSMPVFALEKVIRDGGLIERFSDFRDIRSKDNIMLGRSGGRSYAEAEDKTRNGSIIYKMNSDIRFVYVHADQTEGIWAFISEDGTEYEEAPFTEQSPLGFKDVFEGYYYLKLEFAPGVKLYQVEVNTRELRSEDTAKAIIDYYDDFSKIFSQSPGFALDSSKPEERENDPSCLIMGKAEDKASIIYKTPEDLYGFRLRKYIVSSARNNGQETILRFYVSPDNINYQEVDVPSVSVPKKSSLKIELHETDALPAGMRYFKIEFNGRQVSWNPRLGKLELYYGDKPAGGMPSGEAQDADENSNAVAKDPNAGMETVTVPSPAEVVAKVRERHPEQGHPRILAVQSDFDRIKEDLKTDEYMQRAYQKVLKTADEIIEEPVAEYVIPDGKRLLDTSRKVKSRALTLGMAYRLSGENQYAQRLYEELEAVSQFPNWNPSHFLDVGEMSFAFGVAYDWIYDYMTDAQRKTVRDALVQFGLKEALSYMERGEGFTQNINNWNTVCNGGVSVGALAIADEEPELAGQVVSYAVRYTPKAYAESSPDGCYPEGPGYWSYGTSYATYLICALDTACGASFGLDQIAGYDKTALFPVAYTGQIGQTFNFGDGGAAATPSSHLLWLAKKYHHPIAAWYQRKYQETGGALELLWYDPAIYKTPQEAEMPLDLKFDGNEAMAVHRGSYDDKDTVYAAIKAGDNQSSHGDLDIGTFVLDALGVRWAMELGAETYDIPGYWSMGADAGRWTYYRKRAEGHNTLVMNPSAAADQNVYAVDKIDQFVSEATGGYTVVDMSKAYRQHAKSAKRGLMLYDSRTKILLQDEIKFRKPSELYWFMHTDARIEIGGGGKEATLSKGGKQLAVTILSEDPQAVFSVLPAEPLDTSPRPSENLPNSNANRLTIHMLEQTETTLPILFTPIQTQNQEIELPEVQPLSSWTIPEINRAKLDSLMIDDWAYSGFKPEQFVYHVEVPFGADLPQKVSAASSEAEVEISQPTAESPEAVIRLSPRDSAMKPSVYTVSFSKQAFTGFEGTGETGAVLDKLPDGVQQYQAVAVEASAVPEPANIPENTLDGDLDTKWAADGEQWIQYDLGSEKRIGAVAVAFMNGDARRARLTVHLSRDGKVWEDAYAGESSGTTNKPEFFIFDAQDARYVRIVGYGNSVNSWNSLTEVEFYSEISVGRSFQDIKGHWAEKEITELAGKGIIKGVNDYEYLPDTPVTFAEFAALAAREAGLEEIPYEGSFRDVSDTDWYAGAVQALYRAGAISEEMTPDGLLRPGEPIRREVMAALLAKLDGGIVQEPDSDRFADSAEIADWARASVDFVAEQGILQGNPGNLFAPKAFVTRAEAAVVIKRMMNRRKG